MLVKRFSEIRFLFFFLLLCVSAQEEPWRWGVSRVGEMVKREERRILAMTEYGAISAIDIIDDIRGPYHLQFITMEPHSLFLPVLLHADMVLYVYSGSGKLSWADKGKDEMRNVYLEKGDVFRVQPGSVFYLQSNLETEREKLRIHAIFTSTDEDPYEGRVGAYSSISDLLSGFEKRVLQSAFKAPEEIIEAITNTTRPPAIVHAVEKTKSKFPEWEPRLLKSFLGGNYALEAINKKKDKTFNLLRADPDVGNCNGWSRTVTRKDFHRLKGSNVGIFMVNLTRGSMMGPHWNPTATEIAIVIRGRGMVQFICNNSSIMEPNCRSHRFRVKEGDVFSVPRFFPMAQISFNNESFVFMGFSTATKKNNPQFLAGKSSVLQVLDKRILATSFNVTNTTIDRLLDSQGDSIILECTSCAEEEEAAMEREIERERAKEEARKRAEEEARKKEEEERKRKEEEEARKREEEERAKEEARKRAEEEARKKEEEERRRKEEEEARKREEDERAKEEAIKRAEEEARKKEEEERRRKEEEEARKREEEERAKEEAIKRAEEEARKKEEEERRRKEEEEARKREEEKATKREEEEAKRKEEEKKTKEKEEAWKREEEEARKRQEEEARKREEQRRREEEATKREEEEARGQQEERERSRRQEEAARSERKEEEEAKEREEEKARRQQEERENTRRQEGEEAAREREEEKARRQEEEREQTRRQEEEREQTRTQEEEAARRWQEERERQREQEEETREREEEKAKRQEEEREERRRQEEAARKWEELARPREQEEEAERERGRGDEPCEEEEARREEKERQREVEEEEARNKRERHAEEFEMTKAAVKFWKKENAKQNQKRMQA